MILTMDIGNTNIKTALFDGKEMYKYWRMSTSATSTSDEYGVRLSSMFAHEGVPTSVVDGIVVSSVVPTINFTIDHMLQNYFGKAPLFVAPGVKTGINIRYENPRELGSDRIANAVAAYDEYGGPCIFIDFGTATTYGVLSDRNEFLGGAIGPGLRMMNRALSTGTAKLPSIELTLPETTIGRTTVTNIQSGILYGYIGSIERIVNQMKREMGKENVRVVATGGMAYLVAENSEVIDEINPDLTLTGLRMIYEKNL